MLESMRGPAGGVGLAVQAGRGPPELTSGPGGLVGDGWEAGSGEKGLRGLVRPTELMGLAGLVVL